MQWCALRWRTRSLFAEGLHFGPGIENASKAALIRQMKSNAPDRVMEQPFGGMNITTDVFDAYLKCPTKCWLRANGEASGDNLYAQWVKTQTATDREAKTLRLVAEFSNSDVEHSPSAKTAKSVTWHLATGMAVQAEIGGCVLVSGALPEDRG